MVMWLLGVSLGVVVLLCISHFEKWEKMGSELAGGLLLASLPFVFLAFSDLIFLIPALVVHLWLLLLPARLVGGRLEREFLLQSTFHNAWLGLCALLGFALLEAWRPVQLAETGIALLLAASMCASIFFLGQLWWNTRRFKVTAPLEAIRAKDLPTVSVCIPARNEDHALADCLTAVLQSDYQKLEVLVLDDCSQDQTSSIIKSFAHDGVRFIQGESPASGWLGKNQALATLASQASGEYLLFIDVDTHVAPQSINTLVQYMISEGLHMASVLPQNRLGAAPSTLFGTFDYFWRQVLPITRRHVPVSSKSWMVTAQALHRLGGFASVSRKIIPEESFAHRLEVSDRYRFVVSDAILGITTAKHWPSQINSAIRLTYPQFKRQPIQILGGIAAVALVSVAPFVILVWALITSAVALLWLSALACLLLIATYAVTLHRSHPKTWLLSGLLWPVVAVQEVILMGASMVQYEFGEVNWKGRNVCYPVLSPVPPRIVRPE